MFVLKTQAVTAAFMNFKLVGTLCSHCVKLISPLMCPCAVIKLSLNCWRHHRSDRPADVNGVRSALHVHL